MEPTKPGRTRGTREKGVLASIGDSDLRPPGVILLNLWRMSDDCPRMGWISRDPAESKFALRYGPPLRLGDATSHQIGGGIGPRASVRAVQLDQLHRSHNPKSEVGEVQNRVKGSTMPKVGAGLGTDGRF